MSRLLGLSKHSDGAPGLVLIQIDGLSHEEIQRALEKGEMPFASRLMRREGYTLRPMYSGLPSNTAAMQGELMYGVPGVVPAFSFLDRTHQCVSRMIEPEAALRVEKELAGKGVPLLCGGSSYGNVYTGGAEEPRWCAASMGWGTATKAPGLLTLMALVLLNLWGFVRTLAFAALEFMLAFWDAFRGAFSGEHVAAEFKFIPARVGVCILMREWITEGAKMDIARGLPVVHLNFIGYDEQSHRRGPDAAFAHWVLKGIDDSIKRIHTATRKSKRRKYTVWIYSDHGQVKSQPYVNIMGMTLPEKVRELYAKTPLVAVPRKWRLAQPRRAGEESQRIRMLGGRRLQKFIPVPSHTNAATHPQQAPVVTDLGPVGLVYLDSLDGADKRHALGEQLARAGGVPIVIDKHSHHGLRGWTADGEFHLPRDAEKILGDHPYRALLLPDLERLCRHRLSGDLILLGWKSGITTPVTFAQENGSHGGISPQECTAFFLGPPVSQALLITGTIRPVDLHEAVLAYRKGTRMRPSKTAGPSAAPGRLRVMTYNVHACVGMDGRHDIDRVAQVIAAANPDVVCLQELDHGNTRSEKLHQAREIAERLKFDYHYHAAREVEDERFGNAILTRHPVRLIRAAALPAMPSRRTREPRGALWVEVDWDGSPIHIVNTHLGLRSEERRLQVEALLGSRWLGSRDQNIPLVLCGDLNCGPNSREVRELRTQFNDVQTQLPNHRPRNTWATVAPIRRIDHILVSQELGVLRVEVPQSSEARRASDHLPLIAELSLRKAAPGRVVASLLPGGRHVA